MTDSDPSGQAQGLDRTASVRPDDDRALLEAAARAAGIAWSKAYRDFVKDDGNPWRPLTDDGDALRLAVKLRMDVDVYYGEVEGERNQELIDDTGDPYAATRRAIVRAAASMAGEA